MAKRRKIRLFTDSTLVENQHLDLSKPLAHYLGTVMRMDPGDEFLMFNGRDGEWSVALREISRKSGRADVRSRIRPQPERFGVTLFMAPIKKARLELLIEKAVEIGVDRVQLVETDHTDSHRLNLSRLRAIAIEAAEQSGAMLVPDIVSPEPLATVLERWSGTVLFADEKTAGQTSRVAIATAKAPAAILIGPEGGFTDRERRMICDRQNAIPVSLGPQILRAETAAMAGLLLWHGLRTT